jgi:hypothetical protein
MEIYKNFGGDSRVASFKIGGDSIAVQFNTGKVYLYTYRSAGNAHIEKMKSLARAGEGLNSYINKNAKLY